MSLLHKVYTLAKAISLGSYVSEERIRRRLEVCAACDKLEVVKDRDTEIYRCGICGCMLKGDKTLVNLAAYEETADYGCKHPDGSKWKDI